MIYLARSSTFHLIAVGMIAISAAVTSAAFAAAEKTCPDLFASLPAMGESPTPLPLGANRLVPPKPSVLSNAAVETVRRERDRLRTLVDRDFKEFPTDETIIRTNFGETLSEDAVQASNKMSALLKADLEKQGFIVSTEKLNATNAFHNGVLYEIPERTSLIIRPGSAKGPFARELRRFEKYIADRKKDPALPAEVKAMDFSVRVDPLSSVAHNTHGFFSNSEDYGRGLHLSPAAIFNGQDVTLEVMRHELRHIKNHFNLLTGKPSTNRAILFDPNTPLGENIDNYTNMFTVDEIEGFTANIRNSQSKIGRETEAYRKLATENPTASGDLKKVTKQYRKAVEAVQREARTYAEKVSKFIEISYENATAARNIIADPSTPQAQFASRISVVERPFLPGIAEVSISLAKDGKWNGRKLIIQMPTSVTAKGTEAIRENAMAYLVELDTYLLEQKRELAVRLIDIERDPLSRLPPSLRPNLSKPDSN